MIWFLIGVVVVAGPQALGLVMDLILDAQQRQKEREQARRAIPFVGNACQIFHRRVVP